MRNRPSSIVHRPSSIVHRPLIFRACKISLVMMTMFLTHAFMNSAKAQTADSALVVTDSSVTTSSNVVVTDSSGTTTLFAGGQQSNYSGMVGVGTSTLAVKLHVYDDYKANFRLSQRVSHDSTQATARSSNHQHTAQSMISHTGLTQGNGQHLFGQQIMGNNGQPIDNFDITIIDEGTSDGMFPTGTLVQSTSMGNGGPILTGLTARSGMNTSNQTEVNPCMLDPNQYPKTLYQSGGFGWYVPACPGPNYHLVMYLGSTYPDGSSFINIDAVANFKRGLNIDGEFIINNTTTNNKIFEVHQADNYVYARDIHVTQNNFPDYVFAKDYKLMGLKELENYINAHHHLPEMPTAKEVADNNLSVSETTTLLTKKIEELTLYMLELKKENEEIKAELKSVRK